MTEQTLAEVVASAASLTPDRVALTHGASTATFGDLERSAGSLRAAVPSFAALPDSAVFAAVTVLLPGLGTDVEADLRSAAHAPIHVVDTFLATAQRTPDLVAITDGERTLTYAQLDRQSQQRAGAYARDGLTAGQSVVFRGAESIDAAIGMLAVVRLGAYCVQPGDVQTPASWSEFESLPTDSESVASGSAALLDSDVVVRIRRGDRCWDFGHHAVLAGSATVVDAGSVALWWHAHDPLWGVAEFWGALTTGSTLAVRREGTDVLDDVRDFGVTVLTATVHEAAALRDRLLPDETPTLKTILVDGVIGGEFAAPVVGRTVRLLPEVIGDLTISDIEILDRRLRRVPTDVAGVVYLPEESGRVGRTGYFEDTDSDSLERVASLYPPAGSLMRRTGLRATKRRDSSVEILESAETTVVRRGVRVDTDDVAGRIRRLPGVEDAALLTVEKDELVRIVAFAVVDESIDTDTSSADIRTAAEQSVPDYAMPDAVVVTAALPLRPGGRVDVGKLESIYEEHLRNSQPVHVDDDVEIARTPSLEIVQSIFADVLGVSRVGFDESFFDIGGSSLSATRVVARVNAATHAQLRVADIFDAATPRALAMRLKDRRGDTGRATYTDFAKAPRPARIPIAPAQLRLWILDALAPGSPAYNVPLALRLTGSLDIDALAESLRDLARRHEILRTVFPDDGEGPTQVVLDCDSSEHSVAPDLPVTELHVVDADQDAAMGEITRFVTPGFEPTRSPAWRAMVVRISDDEHIAVLCLHHLLIDGESLLPLATDLVTAYYARLGGSEPQWSEPAPQYADYALWQSSIFGTLDAPTPLAQNQIERWTRELSGLPDVLELPTDHTTETGAAEFESTLTVDVHRVITDYARTHGVSEHMVLLAVFEIALARWTGATDFAVGVPTAGRGEAELATGLGTFVGTVAMRARIDLAAPFDDVVATVRATALGAYDNADVPYDWVVAAVRALDPGRGTEPLYRVGFAYREGRAGVENVFDGVNVEDPNFDGLRVAPLDTPVLAVKDDLLLTAQSRLDADGRPAGIELSFVYSAELFCANTIEQFSTAFDRILDEALDPDKTTPVGDFDVLGGDAERAALADLVGPPALREDALLPDLLTSAVDTHRNSVAVRIGDRDVTYDELDRRSTRLARQLIALGCGPETFVALVFPRSLDVVLALWAVAKTGAAYVPIDPHYPVKRLQHMVSDSQVTVGLTNADAISTLPPLEWISIEDEWARPLPDESAPVTDQQRTSPIRASNAAYVIYTSGSTGVPKAVVVTHSGFAGLAADTRTRFGTTDKSRPAQTISPSFDPYVMDMFVFALAGATLIVVPADIGVGPEMTKYLSSQRVTHMSTTPGILSTLDDEILGIDMEMISIGGEAPPPALRDAWGSKVRLNNAYGPTEATVASHFATLEVGKTVLIGRPIAGVAGAVLDSRLHPVIDGSVGELYLFGNGLAREYHRRPFLTASRFMANPYVPGGRMYRTGDLVRAVRSPDDDTGYANLRYVGRVDTQIKIRGFRVELGEIDAALASLPSIDRAVTIGADAPGGQRALVSYFTRTADAAPRPVVDELVSSLAEILPPQSIPASLMEIDEFVLTTNGKIDVSALPTPTFGAAEEIVAPRTATESAVLAAFLEVLGAETLSVHANFFSHGGNSLSATRVVARVERSLGVRVALRELFDAPTAAQLAAVVDHASITGSGDDSPALPLVAGERPDVVPLSLAQSRMWFANRFDPSSVAHNVPMVVRIVGAFDIAAFSAAMRDVITRHEILRTRYPDSDVGPRQKVLPPSSVDTRLTAVHVSSADITSAVIEFAAVQFDVTAAPPVAMRLWMIDDDGAADSSIDNSGSYVFALVVHHTSTDGESIRPLVADIATAYLARSSGTPPAFVPLPVQYSDYAVWQRLRFGDEDDPTSMTSRHIAYWQSALADVPEVPILRADHPRPAVLDTRANTVSVELDQDVHAAVHALAERYSATPFMVMHAAATVFLSRWSGSNDIVMGTPVAGRGDPALDDLVGMFAGTLTLRSHVDQGASFEDLLRSVRDRDLAAFAHSELPFERVVDALAPRRSTAQHPLFQIMMSFQNVARPVLEFAGIQLTPLDPPAPATQFDMHIVMSETVETDRTPATFAAAITYSAALFDESTAQAWAETFATVVRSVTVDPQTPVGDCEFVSGREAASLLRAGRSTPTELPATTLSDMVAASISAHPDRVAIVDGEKSLTYAELGERIAERRDELRRDGVGAEAVVAVEMTRSADMMVEMCAILAAGGAYLPIDPTWPSDRSDRVRRASRPADCGPARPASPAYCIFTSGSTGEPKGVVVSNSAVCNQMSWLQGQFGLGETDAVLWRTSASFDLSVWELWWPLIAGARLVVGSPDAQRDPAVLAADIERFGVTVMTFVPSLLSAFLTHCEDGSSSPLTTIRHILCIGEALPADTVNRVHEAARHAETQIGLHNLYGPTEAAVSITHHRVS